MQMKIIGALLDNEKVTLHSPSIMFRKMVDIYNNDLESFQIILNRAKGDNDMKADIKAVTDKVGNIKEEDRVKMMVYDSGEDKAMAVGSGLANNLIELAGGNNIFADSDQPYINATWESVVAENPEVIVVTDYLAGSLVEDKIEFLKSHPGLKDVDAIKNNRIYVVGLADLSPGVRNPMVIEKMYGYFYGDNK